MKLFYMFDSNETFTAEEMLAANVDDVAVCEFINNANVDDVFFGHFASEVAKRVQ